MLFSTVLCHQKWYHFFCVQTWMIRFCYKSVSPLLPRCISPYQRMTKPLPRQQCQLNQLDLNRLMKTLVDGLLPQDSNKSWSSSTLFPGLPFVEELAVCYGNVINSCLTFCICLWFDTINRIKRQGPVFICIQKYFLVLLWLFLMAVTHPIYPLKSINKII